MTGNYIKNRVRSRTPHKQLIPIYSITGDVFWIRPIQESKHDQIDQINLANRPSSPRWFVNEENRCQQKWLALPSLQQYTAPVSCPTTNPHPCPASCLTKAQPTNATDLITFHYLYNKIMKTL